MRVFAGVAMSLLLGCGATEQRLKPVFSEVLYGSCDLDTECMADRIEVAMAKECPTNERTCLYDQGLYCLNGIDECVVTIQKTLEDQRGHGGNFVVYALVVVAAKPDENGLNLAVEFRSVNGRASG